MSNSTLAKDCYVISDDKIDPIKILPGMTASGVIKALNLPPKYKLAPVQGSPFGDSEEVYPSVSSGDQLLARPDITVGSRKMNHPVPLLLMWCLVILDFVFRAAVWVVKALLDFVVAVLNESGTSKKRRLSQVSRKQLFQMRGFRIKGTALEGRLKAGNVKCVIEDAFSAPKVFLHNPPEQVLKGKHRACYREVGPGIWSVHFNKAPRDPNSAILGMEHQLLEDLG